MNLRDEFLFTDGPYTTLTLERYAPDPLGPMKTYGSVAALGDYNVWDFPDLKSRRIDLSGISPLGMGAMWPFKLNEIPINGFVVRPAGPGPFPLVVMAHGNADWAINSTRGYIYLAQLLASHGFNAATIDCNFLNATGMGSDMDGRALMMLEHIKQFKIWNGTAGHPLEGKIDLNRILLMGHSRGGEAAAIATVFNLLDTVDADFMGPTIPLDGSMGFGPYKFGIKSVVAFAPTDQNPMMLPPWGSIDLKKIHYLVVHGNLDFDVRSFRGQKTYDRALFDPMDPNKDPGALKGLVWVIGGCHAYFNNVWPLEFGFPTGLPAFMNALISYGAQQQVAKTCLTGFAYATLSGRTDLLPVYPPYRSEYPAGSKERVLTTSQYQGARRLFLQHFQETGTTPKLSSPVTGSISTTAITAEVSDFDDGDSGFRFQTTRGLKLVWTNTGTTPRYEITIDAGKVDFTKWLVFQFRAGASGWGSPIGILYSVEFSDGMKTVRFPAHSFMTTPYPASWPDGSFSRLVMQTIRVPLNILETSVPPIDRSALKKIAFVFDGDTAGTLFMDDLQVTD